tara:strand:+ start:322 stop:582 length:261 start_codon:yes stop_codon:yes gene_type:complete
MRSLAASLLVTGLRAQPASPPSFPSGGTGTCPCAGWDSTEYESDGAIQLTLGATTYAYPTTYGKGRMRLPARNFATSGSAKQLSFQ